MSKLIVSEFITLDGVVEAPGGEPTHRHTGWVGDYFDDEIFQTKLAEILAAESQLLGRVTYESFAEAWPQRDGPMAEKLNGMPKYVASTTLTELEWANSTLLGPDIGKEVARLKEAGDGPILVHGSRTLVQTLLEHDLVDEWVLMVFPVVLGSGMRLFPDDREPKTPLRLKASRSFASGVVQNTYERPS